MKIRKAWVDYNKKGMPTTVTVEYAESHKLRNYGETWPMTVTEFVMMASECKTYYTPYGTKFDVYEA